MANQCRKRATESTQPAPKPDARATADALIAKATSRGESLPDFLRNELVKLMAHNDAAQRTNRVSGDAAMELLRSHGKQMSRQTFDRLIKAEFGRRWGSQ